MSEETLRRATEPFFTTKGLGKGTGLGLSMVHGLADQFGGRFVLKSQEGVGTTAELWLPAAAGRADVLDKVRLSTSDARAEYTSLVVVVVDDDPLILTNTIAMLEAMGHTG